MTDEATAKAQPVTAAIEHEIPITGTEEVLFRQVHPSLYDSGQPASSAFLPSPGDHNQLSTDRGSLTTARGAYDLYVANNRRSVGTYGVTVGEFGREGLKCFPDPIGRTETTQANPAHARVDFSSLGTNQQKKAAKRLKLAAVSRGILYRP